MLPFRAPPRWFLHPDHCQRGQRPLSGSLGRNWTNLQIRNKTHQLRTEKIEPKPKQNVVIQKYWHVKCLCGRCLLEFIDWRYSQSCWYLRPSFVKCCPSDLLSGSTLHPSTPYLCEYVCGGGGYGVLGLRQINTCRKVPLQVNFYMTTFALPSMNLVFLRVEFIQNMS